MLGDLCNAVGGGLFLGLRGDRSRWFQEVLTHEGELADASRRDAHPVPVLRRAVEHRPEQRETAALARESSDDLDATSCLAECALDEIGMPDALVVLTREAQVSRQGLDVTEQTLDRRGVEPLEALGEGVDASTHLVDGLLAGLGLDVVKELPERRLHLALGGLGHLGEDVLR